MRNRTLREQLKREKKIRTKIILLLSFVVFTFIAYSFFFGNMGYLKYIELKQNEQRLLRDINSLSAANEALKEEIRLLKTDPAYFEKFAKEKFGLVRPGELVFQFKDPEK